MHIIISNSSDKPIYIQLKDQIKSLIISEELKPGEMLPSMRVLAKDLKISVITTKRAYEELEHEGFIETRPSQGCFVANKNKEIIREEQLEVVENIIDNAIKIAKMSHITKKEIKDMVDILYEEDK